MPTAAARVRLGDRYAALGLTAAAAAVYRRATESDPASPAAARRLAELCLQKGDGATARRYADEAARRKPSAEARLLCARALAAAGELAAARFAFAAVLDGSGPHGAADGSGERLRAAAYVGRADVASKEGDGAGAIAHLLAGVEELTAAKVPRGGEGAQPPQSEEDARLYDEIATHAAALGRGGDLADRLRELEHRRPDAPLGLAWGALLGARQAHDDPSIPDADIEAALERALAANPESRSVRLRLALRLSRRRYRDAQARGRAISILEALAAELDAGATHGDEEAARVWFLLAGLYEDDAATHPRAEAAYRTGLRLRPRHAPAANNLALLRLAAGDAAAARRELAHALRLDGHYDVAWRNVARILDATRPASSFAEDVAGWLDAASPGVGAVAGDQAAHLYRATAEYATQGVLEALHAKGHRLKNLLGIAGARVRHLRKSIANREVGVELRLDELEREVQALYEEWAAHLRSMQAEGPRLEIIPVNPLVGEVVAAATQEGRPPVRFTAGAALPELRGDRALLREALLNLIVNGLEAQEARGETENPVEVATQAVVGAGGAPAVEIGIRDRGGGITPDDMARIFAPGFTTKPSGSGLGLAVADRVVAAHHGRILIDSEVDRGTTVTVILPSDLGGFSSLALTRGSRAEL